jgi:hypothetical protein
MHAVGAGVGSVSYDSTSSWLEGTDTGLDARWNAELIKQRKIDAANEAEEDRQEAIALLKAQLQTVQSNRADLNKKIQELEQFVGERELARNETSPVDDKEQEDDCNEDMQSFRNVPLEHANPPMETDPLPSLTQGLTPPPDHFPVKPKPVIKIEDEGELVAKIGTTSQEELSDEDSKMNTGPLFQEPSASEIEVSRQAKSMLSAHDLFSVPESHKTPLSSVELNSRATWAFMNRVNGMQMVPELPAELSQQQFNDLPETPEVIVPPTDNTPVIVVTTGCCVLDTPVWHPQTQVFTSSYNLEDGVEAANCIATHEANKIHFVGEMCADVQERIDQARVTPKSESSDDMNHHTVQRELQVLTPRVLESNSLFAKTSAASPMLEMTRESLFSADSTVVMPEGDAAAPKMEDEVNVPQPGEFVGDNLEKANGRILHPKSITPNNNVDDKGMPETAHSAHFHRNF